MKRIIKCIGLLVAFSTTQVLLAQENSIEKAAQKVEDFQFKDAQDIYLKVVKNGYGSAEVYKRLADTYYFNADYKEAAKWYGELNNLGKIYDTEYLFRYALSLKSTGDYEKSDEMMEAFDKLNKGDDRGENFEDQKNYLDIIQAESGKFLLFTQTINGSDSEFAPAFYGDKVTFASNRKGATTLGTSKVHDWNDKPFYDLYEVGRVDNSSLKDVNEFSKKINTNFHESTAVFTSDLQTMYFTRNNFTKRNYQTDANGVNRLKLYRAVKKGDNWSEAEELPFNSNEYSVAHPALSPDGSILYFSSDMPGSAGSADIWMVKVLGDNTYGTPVNLGKEVNTDGRDTFPFVSRSNMLFWASDGRPGLGGLDIYAIQLDADGKPKDGIFNIGEPVNSNHDDFTFIIDEDMKYGFFASNRPTGSGEDDIYGFIMNEDLARLCAPTLTGTLKEKNTKEPIQDAVVSLRDTNNTILKQVKTDFNGIYDFGTIDCGSSYLIRGVAVGYDTVEERFTAPNKTEAVVKNLEVLNNKLDPNNIKVGDDLAKVLNIPMIYFDFDKSNIRPDAEVELQKILSVMQEYPNMVIDIRSHTDSRASFAYNVALSDRRAKSTRAYLIRKGISASRLKAAGYGEYQLVNECADGVQCTEEEHQLNRRSEFIVIKM
ncbi:MAG: OmpA family protein [Nonlabens sp.]|nr:OmpA family protein [Nonlabens sp.]MDP5101316.1 OmpA family protein [Nonlabens sp.]